MATVERFRYRGFISYSHKDTKFARWLHRGLERFQIDKDLVGRETRVGSIPKHLRPIFMDREDFAAGASLSAQSLRALNASQFLIVVCSPRSAQSTYVNEEVRLFKASGRGPQIIPVIYEGEPGHAELECFPDALRYKVGADGQLTSEREDPLAADAREEGDGREIAKLKVIAGLLGVPLDDIRRRAEEAAQRRFRRWLVVLSGAAAAFAGLAVFAETNRREAVRQKEQAERRFHTALDAAEGIVIDSAEFSSRTGVAADAPLAFLKRAENLLATLATDAAQRPELKHREGRLLMTLSQSYRSLGRTEEWSERAEQAFSILEEIAAGEGATPRWRHDFATSHIRLAEVRQAKGDLGSALKGYQAADDIAQQQISSVSAVETKWPLLSALAKLRIGDIYRLQSRMADALASFNEALAIRADVLADGKDIDQLRDLSVAYEKVAHALQGTGRQSDALKQLQQALELRKQIASQEPDNTGFQRDLAIAHESLGDLQLKQGHRNDARSNYEHSLDIRDRLSTSDPKNIIWQRDVAVTRVKLGDIAAGKQETAKAIEHYSGSRQVLDRLSAFDSTNADWRYDLAKINNRIGDIHRINRHQDEARNNYLASKALLEKLVASDSENSSWLRDLAATELKLSDLLAMSNEIDGALAGYKRAQSTFARIAKRDSSNARLQRDLAITHERVGTLLALKKDTSGAIAQFKLELAILDRLLAKDPENFHTRQMSLVPLGRLGQLSGSTDNEYFDRALSILIDFEKAGRLDPAHKKMLQEIRQLKAGEAR